MRLYLVRLRIHSPVADGIEVTPAVGKPESLPGIFSDGLDRMGGEALLPGQNMHDLALIQTEQYALVFGDPEASVSIHIHTLNQSRVNASRVDGLHLAEANTVETVQPHLRGHPQIAVCALKRGDNRVLGQTVRYLPRPLVKGTVERESDTFRTARQRQCRIKHPPQQEAKK